jgi:predicted nucleotidyltransferase
LRSHTAELEAVIRGYGATQVKVFGSVARGEAEPDSDLDVLVDLDEEAGLLQLAALESELEDFLGCPVHVVTSSGLRYASQSTREQITREAISL